MKTQPDVSAWFFFVGLILLLCPGSETHIEGNVFFSDSFRSLKEKHFGPSRVPLKEKSLQECREPQRDNPKRELMRGEQDRSHVLF